MRRKVLGFTLIELMIVVAIIAIIAAIAIPGLLRARMSANEGNASGSLRSLASSQAEFKNGTKVDQNNNGTGEYGLFNELCGATNLRPRQGNPELARLNPPSINQSLSANAQNFASKAGYNLQIFLPGAVGGGPVTDNGTEAAPPLDEADPNDAAAIVGQENRWISYAWPSSYRTSGVRAFLVDQGGEVYASANTDNNGNGYLFGNAAANMPVYNTAMSNLTAPTETDWQPISVKDNVNVIDTNHTWLPTGT
jgi:prepilin-type N-terminal cleavage/methylation domain-containing protein